MEEFKGVPGPWVTCDAHGPVENGTCVQDTSEREKMIASCCHYAAREQVVANAKLIAAAPELLEELIETHSALCFTPNYLGSLRYKKNKAAIAKALGK